MVNTAVPPKREVYAVFAGRMDTDAAQRITTQLTKFTDPRLGTESIHVLLHSPGGEIPEGVALHNFFKAFPLKLLLYNGGNVDSASVLGFLGARQRRASAYATFTVHRSSLRVEYGRPATDLQYLVNMMLIEDQRIEAIYRDSGIKLTDAQWTDWRNNKDLTFSAEEARTLGFVQEIAEFTPPEGTVLFSL